MSVLIQHLARSIVVVTGYLTLKGYTQVYWPRGARMSKEINDRYSGVLRSLCMLCEVTTETRSQLHGPERKRYTPLVKSWYFTRPAETRPSDTEKERKWREIKNCINERNTCAWECSD